MASLASLRGRLTILTIAHRLTTVRTRIASTSCRTAGSGASGLYQELLRTSREFAALAKT
jgi:ABC-type multidrug transport system fused ATPase/permease subunit